MLIAYLASPVLLQGLRSGGQGLKDPLFLFNFALSVLWLGIAHLLSKRPILVHLVLAPLYITTAVDLFLLLAFGNRLSTGYVTIALTSHLDTPEFFSTYALKVGLIAGILVLIYLPGLYAIRRIRIAGSKRIAAVLFVLIAATYGAAAVRGILHGMTPGQAVLDVASHEMSAPVGVFFQTGLAVKQFVENDEVRSRRSAFSFMATKPASASTEIYVLVIGESSRPQNWSLFGYSRDTTPHMRRTDVIGLPQMLTTAPHTAIAVPSMLSLQPITDWHAVVAQKSIVSAFDEVGFKTYWLSAQPDDNWGGIIPQLAAEAGTRRYYDNQYDGEMLNEFGKVLRGLAPGQKTFVVLHTKGSHFEYSRRYPEPFRRFATAGGDRRRGLIDTYDNSIVYTDWFLDRVIEALKQTGSASALIYASDHGENLLDDDRQLIGHALGTAYDLATASFIWMSEELRVARPEQTANLRRNASAPVSLSNVSHSVLDLAGIQAQGLDRSFSLFSPTFAIHPRSYIVRGTLLHEKAATAPP